jgi:putative transcriptional regulator
MIKVTIVRCLLKDILTRKGITQTQLVDLTGIAKGQLSDYQNDSRMMTIVNAKRIAVALNCSVDELYEYKICKHRD